MEFVRGLIVRSLAGRDQDEFLAVLSCEKPYVLLCNGKDRTLEKPKKKKMIHTAPTNTILKEDEMKTNRAIAKALSHFGQR